MGIRTHDFVKFNNDRALIEFNEGTGLFTITVDSEVIFTGASTGLAFSRGTLAAAGSTAANAGVIVDQVTAVTASDGTKGVALPAAATTVGPILVINTVLTSGGNLKVYPVNGGNDNINGEAEDAAFTMGPGRAAWFVPTSATQWYVEDLSGALTTKAEENILDGVTATAAELNYLDIATLGTGAASKAVVLDSGEDYTWPVAGVLTYGGTAITANGAELNYLDLTTLGTGAASKAVVLDANGAYVGPTAATTKLTWSVTSDSTDAGVSVEPFVHNTTMTGAGGVGGRARFELDTNVALGSWANALKAQLQLGASGKVTGLGSAFVAELIMGAGAADGTYAPLELEIGMPSGALTGTETAFINFTVYDAAAATFDDNGFLFSISGVTKGAGDLLSDTTSGSTARPVQTLKVKTPDGTRYIPLYSTVAIAA